jgi:cytochrome P450
VPIAEDPSLDELAKDPHACWHRLRSQAPVVWVPALGGWVVLTYAAASAVLRDAVTFTVDDPRFSTGQLFGPSMLSTDGAEHERFRAAFAAEFRPTDIRQRFTTLIQDEVARLIAACGRPAEIRTELAGPLAVAVMGAVLGLSEEDPARLLGWYSAIVAGVDAISTGKAAGADAVSAHAALHNRLALSIEQNAAIVGTNGLSIDETVANAGILLFGGLETTEGMIALAVWHALRDPAVWRDLRADPSLVSAAVEESLRLEPAATRVDRYATVDTVVGGVTIPAGDLVIVSLAAANRDPAVFADPDQFDVRRPNAARNLALAAGPHYCLGAHLTRLQTRTVLEQLLIAWPEAALDERQTSEPYGLVFRKPDRVTVAW